MSLPFKGFRIRETNLVTPAKAAGRMRRNLFPYVMKVGKKHGFVIDRISLLPDHMHLIFEAIPSLSIQDCVLAILNNTREWMFQRYAGVLKETDQPNYDSTNKPIGPGISGLSRSRDHS
jgi:REP element-mobilizing transposase RayT